MLPAKLMKFCEDDKLTEVLFEERRGAPNNKYEVEFNFEGEEEDKSKNNEAAWYDEDDDNEDVKAAFDAQGRKLPNGESVCQNKYADYLKRKYQALVGNPKWAELNQNKFCDETSESYLNNYNNKLLQEARQLAYDEDNPFAKAFIMYKKATPLNLKTRFKESVISVVEFHPTTPMALIGGHSGNLSLFTVDIDINDKLHCVSFKEYPIICGRFSVDGFEAYLGSNKPYYFEYDLLSGNSKSILLPKPLTKMNIFEVSSCGKYLAVAGRFSEIHLLCLNTKQIIRTFKQSSEVKSLCFNPSNSKLFSHGQDGTVYVWDLTKHKLFHKFVDHGCVSGSSIALSHTGKFLATGSDEGIVNIYKTKDMLSSSEPKPTRVISNLTTKISGIKFNIHNDICAFYSSNKANAVRIAHVPTFQVYTNFPPQSENVGHCSTVNFSPNSAYLTVGSNRKLAYLYKFKQYDSY